MWKNYSFYLKNLDCANCARELEEQLNKKEHYQNVRVNFSKLKIYFVSDLENNVLEVLQHDVESIERGVKVYAEEVEDLPGRNDVLFLFFGLLSYFGSMIFKGIPLLSMVFVLISYILLGYQTFLKAMQLLKQKILNENFLIVVSALGAFFIAKPDEGFMVLFLYEIGKYLEKRATGNVRRNVEELIALKPTFAHKKKGHDYVTVDPSEVRVGDVLVILNGEKVPLDGVLCSDSCELDTSSLTGESKIAVSHKGDEILSGYINHGGVFEIEVTSLYENSTVKRILDLMEHAGNRKAKTENFVNRAARYYTPIMMMVAFVIFLMTPFLFHISFSESFYRALMVLVVSCPCAIAISVPLCYFAGMGAMSKRGILVKGSNYIDAISKINTFVFDKTGTLTTGNFGVIETKVFNPDYSLEEVISYLVYGEYYSNHPLAKSILKQYPDVSVPELTRVKEIKGKGISYEYNGHRIKLGNEKFVGSDFSVSGTAIYISLDGEVIAVTILGDEVKENASQILSRFQHEHIHTVMFTGDKKEIAYELGQRLGIDEIHAGLLPDDKYHLFEQLKKERNHDFISFVGDGINDAPVLRLSDCGIAMGSGAESAIEASDIVIMSNDLERIMEARNISHKTLRILKENLIFALGIKFIVLIFSFFGIGSMWIAVFADVGVTLLAILNSLRILKS